MFHMSIFVQHLYLLLSSDDVVFACSHTNHCACCVQRLASERDRDAEADEVPADTEVSAGAAAL